jgi:hypothetical protein
VTFIPEDLVNFNQSTATVELTVAQAVPIISWPTPPSITYGTPLGASQLNATASVGGETVPGTFVYLPAAGAIPPAGIDTLTVKFVPTNATAYATVSTDVALAVAQASPLITWPIPVPITYGTALSAMQLNAAASFQGKTLPGSFAYLPKAGTILQAGNQTLSAAFTPEDANNFASKKSTVTLSVKQALPTITWPMLAPVVPGTVLGATQLDAIASWQGIKIPGIYAYQPAAGTVVAAGELTIAVQFTPNDTTDYATATATAVLEVSGLDFNMTPSGSTATQTVSSGGQATYTFTLAPTDATKVFVNDVTFDVTGLPPGWAAPTFTPAKIAAGTVGAQTVRMSVQAGPVSAKKSLPRLVGFAGTIATAILLMPWRRIQAGSKKLSQLALLTLLLGTAGLFIVLSACGTGTLPAQTYNLVVTATSGGATTSSKITLIVQ